MPSLSHFCLYSKRKINVVVSIGDGKSPKELARACMWDNLDCLNDNGLESPHNLVHWRDERTLALFFFQKYTFFTKSIMKT